MHTLSKGEFATHIGVTPGRVSQYLNAGIIGPDALVGDGRAARINVAKAVEQIRLRRHIGQSLGNGLLTDLRLQPAEPSPAATAPASPMPELTFAPSKDDASALIQLERLESERRKNRLAAIDEARSLGQLVEGEALQREVGKAAQAVVNAFTGMAPDIANAIAAEFSLPQRDVLHLVRRVMNERRAVVAASTRSAAETLPETEDVAVA